MYLGGLKVKFHLVPLQWREDARLYCSDTMAAKTAGGENRHLESLMDQNEHLSVTIVLYFQILNSYNGRCDVWLFVSRFALSSMDMEQRDYDLRTALHVAAAEGLIRPHTPFRSVFVWVPLYDVLSWLWTTPTDAGCIIWTPVLSGHTEVVHFLLEGCRVNPVPRDRWVHTPSLQINCIH